MNKISIYILLLLLSGNAWAQVDRSIKPKPGPAPEIKLGKTESFVLPNGMQVFVVENHRLPTIECSIELDIKPELQGNMAGYRDMMSELLLSGTASRPKDKLNSEIDEMGAHISASDEGISGSGLKKYSDKILDLIADIAMNTTIKESELELVKKKTISELETEKNEPDAMVRNVSAIVNYGPHHSYGEIPTEESIKNITLERCNNYYHTYFRPNVAYMAIVGDVTMSEVKPMIEKYFGKWEKKEVPATVFPNPAQSLAQINKPNKVYFAPRTAAVQSVVNVTYPIDLKPGTPDVIKARVANTVLGGGSQGRLFLDLREKHAWTYGAYSSLKDDEIVGDFSAEVKCRNIVSDSAIQAILDEMRMMQTEKVNDTALQNSITYLSGSFAIGLEDPARVAQYAINIERYHMPKDFYQNYLKSLAAVTAADVVEMSKKYIHPDHVNIVVAGSKEEVAPKLARFSADGKIDYFDYAGRPIAATDIMSAPAGVTAEKVFGNYIKALGGEKGIKSVKDIKTTGTTSMQGMTLTITEIKKEPNKLNLTIDMEMGGKKMVIQKQVYNGKKGYQEAQGRKADLTGDDLDEIVEEADLYADLHPEKYGIRRTLKGMENVNGANVYVLDAVNAKGRKTTEYYDAISGLLVKKVQGEGEKAQTYVLADYKEVPGTSGYKVPYKVSVSGAGTPAFTENVKSVEVNKNIPDSQFD